VSRDGICTCDASHPYLRLRSSTAGDIPSPGRLPTGSGKRQGRLVVGPHRSPRPPRYLSGGSQWRGLRSPGSVWLSAPVEFMIRGVLSPGLVALVDRW